MALYEPSQACRGSIGEGTIGGGDRMRPYEPSQAGHVTIGEATICDHMSPHRPAMVPYRKGPYTTIRTLTGRPRRHRGRDHMQSYEASQTGHGTIEEKTVCDHMRPHRPAMAPYRKGPYATV